MSNIIFFPRKAVAAAAGAHPTLAAVWQRNPDNGRLECHWIVERVPFPDEGPRANVSHRQAA